MSHSNVPTVISFEIVRTLRSKAFWAGSLLGPILIAVIAAVAGFSSASASSIGQDSSDTFSFEWVDKSGIVDSTIAQAAGGTQIADSAQGVDDVKSGKVDAFFEYPQDPAKDPVLVTAQDAGIIDSSKYPSVAGAILTASASEGVPNPDLIPIISGNVSTSVTTYKDGEISAGIWGMVVPLALVVIFFIIIVMQSNRMLTATLEEKENRVTEMILTTIKPTQLITGKMIALGVIGLIQVVVIVIPTLIVGLILQGAGIVSGFDLSKIVVDPVTVILTLLMMVGSILLFTATLVAIGAAMPTVKDAQGWYTTVILLLVLPIYAVVYMLTQPNSPIVLAFTFFPWTAPIPAMLRLALGMMPWWQSVIVIVILYGFAYVVYRIASRLFQYGSVEYTKKLNLKTVLASDRKK